MPSQQTCPRGNNSITAHPASQAILTFTRSPVLLLGLWFTVEMYIPIHSDLQLFTKFMKLKILIMMQIHSHSLKQSWVYASGYQTESGMLHQGTKAFEKLWLVERNIHVMITNAPSLKVVALMCHLTLFTSCKGSCEHTQCVYIHSLWCCSGSPVVVSCFHPPHVFWRWRS